MKSKFNPLACLWCCATFKTEAGKAEHKPVCPVTNAFQRAEESGQKVLTHQEMMAIRDRIRLEMESK